jgi:hypothetical protein
MRTFRIRRDSWSVLAGILRANEPFKTAGSMRGETSAVPFKGHMPHEEFLTMVERMEKAGSRTLDYAVWSYSTIIGYRIGAIWHVPDCKYSTTTTIQQNKLRVAVNA